MRHPFLRTLAGSAATPTDPNFENVTLLLHGDGTNGGQNNTFVDGSTNNFTITRNGNTTQGTFSPYGDNWSNYFDGTGDDLSLTGQNLSATDWTIECWVYFQSFANNAPHVWNFGADVNNRYNVWRNSSTGKFSFTRVNGGSYDIKNGTTSPVVGRWYHVAVVRVNSTGVQTLYVDGVAEVTNTGSISTGTTWTLGVVPGGGTADRMLGYISNFRVVTSAVYTANFTPPTAPLTAITNTSLLTCSTNRFRDVSSNNRTITRNGDVSVQRFSPFSPTAAYAAGTIGGSGYFDGTGDYLQLTGGDGFNLTGDFTVEAWIYRTATGSQRIVGKWNLTGNLAWVLETSTTAIGFGVANSGTFSASLSFSATINLFAWNHVAVSRSGSTVRAFLNGADLGSATSSANCTANNTNPIQIGQTENVNYVNGYVCDVRVLKGTAQYTAAFTPPTAPLTAITNTSLLLNFQNAAILDNAMMAVPETVGNAQIDTTTKKFGTGSLEFDGTGDYLSIPPTSEFEFGTGDFTVECWFYASTVSGGEIPIYKQHAASNGICEIRISSSKIYGKTVTDQTVGAGTTTLSTNTWYHVAFVKSSNVYTLYLNGVSEGGTVTNSTGIVRPTTVRVGSNQTAGVFFTGFIDDLRVTKGVARYTSNFTAPTAAFPDL